MHIPLYTVRQSDKLILAGWLGDPHPPQQPCSPANRKFPFLSSFPVAREGGDGGEGEAFSSFPPHTFWFIQLTFYDLLWKVVLTFTFRTFIVYLWLVLAFHYIYPALFF